MKKLITSAVLTLLCALALPGCVGEPDDSEPTDEELSSVDGELSSCCSEGTYYCPALDREWDYAPPGCGAATKPNARDACYAACGVAGCEDSGWQDACE
jgi:hypothetical protein